MSFWFDLKIQCKTKKNLNLKSNVFKFPMVWAFFRSYLLGYITYHNLLSPLTINLCPFNCRLFLILIFAVSLNDNKNNKQITE